MRCYICETEFEDNLPKCPSCGTAYEVDVKESLGKGRMAYTGVRTSGFDPPPGSDAPSMRQEGQRFMDEGLAHAHAGQFGPAQACFRQASLYMPDNPDALFFLASSLFKLGRYLEAMENWQRVSEMEHGNARSDKWIVKAKTILEGDF